MLNRIVVVSLVVGGLIAGCYWAPGEDNPPQLHNSNWPNHGAYGPDAIPYDGEIDAGFLEVSVDADVIDASWDATTEADAPNNCITQCVPKQCGVIANQCNGYIACPACNPNEECVDNFCRAKPPACVVETDAVFCTRNVIQCGSFSANDNCGQQRTNVNCGTCQAPLTCNQHVCACQAETNIEFCARQNKECGLISGTDNCGAAREITCGVCVEPLVCGDNHKCELPPIVVEPVEP